MMLLMVGYLRSMDYTDRITDTFYDVWAISTRRLAERISSLPWQRSLPSPPRKEMRAR